MLAMILLFPLSVQAQKSKKSKSSDDTSVIVDKSLMGALKFRSIGPAIASGRIADIAVNPENPAEYYVGTASGGLWKTTNNGTTFKSIFDQQPVFSIGCLAIDPKNPNVVWAGTGENNSQRNLAYGDGIYKTLDAGKTWKNMGLKKSEHIGKIIIHPDNTDIVYAACQGPAWGPGGDRGLYKTSNGGESWELILEISKYTGISDLAMDPRNPDILYAVAHQRERRVYSKIDGGPESAIYKSTDGGKNWRKLSNGLPSGDVGRIGIAVSPPNPDIVYAIIELPGNKGGFYRSLDMGESWEKRSNEISSSPQYYQEIHADLVDPDRVISLNTFNMLSDDGGKTFRMLGEKNKHVDNHSLWMDPVYTRHYIAGCDGGIYESFDRGKNWLFKSNLPISQFYHVRTDMRFPFYNVYGGAQDNGSWIGPSRTRYRNSLNEDWIFTTGGDGYLSIPEPGNPDISYASSQYGGMVRYDEKTGNTVDIKPQPKNNETYRFNWNTPYFISPHNNTTLYAAANKIFKSTDRGDSWTEISGDLSRQIDVNTLPMMGKIWPPEAIAKSVSTSPFGNIFALAESPLKQGLLYAGTDDGLIQVSENDGGNWTKYESFPGVPDMTFVNYILPSKHDENTVYACFDGRKNNSDFKPYLLKSTDKGKSWRSIASNLPDGTVYVIREDHINKDILFIGTEWGVYLSLNGGNKWIRLKSGLPPIQVKDLDIQERENDLVVASFGRGFYILENYAYLRELNEDILNKEAYIFDIKDAMLYYPARHGGSMGDVYYKAANPRVEASFTYYYSRTLKTASQLRKAQHAKDLKAGKIIKYPGRDELWAEDTEQAASLVFTIFDANDNIITRLKASPKKGIARISWNMSYPSAMISDGRRSYYGSGGPKVPPGTYKVNLSLLKDGKISPLTEAKEFKIVSWDNSSLENTKLQEKYEFLKEVNRLSSSVNISASSARDYRKELETINKALMAAPAKVDDLMQRVSKIDHELFDILTALSGRPVDNARIDVSTPSIRGRISFAGYASSNSFHRITGSQKEQYEIARKQYVPVYEKLKKINDIDMPALRKALDERGIPWTKGRMPIPPVKL